MCLLDIELFTFNFLSFETDTKHGVLYWNWTQFTWLVCSLYFCKTFKALKSKICTDPWFVPTAIKNSSFNESDSAKSTRHTLTEIFKFKFLISSLFIVYLDSSWTLQHIFQNNNQKLVHTNLLNRKQQVCLLWKTLLCLPNYDETYY